MRPTRFVAAVGAWAAAFGLLVPSVAAAKVERDRAGGVEAVLSYEDDDPQVMWLEITRDGERVYDAAVESRKCGAFCRPGGFGNVKSVEVAQVSGDATPEVVLRLFSGGNHCCTIGQVLTLDARAGEYRVAGEHDFADAPFGLARSGSRSVFHTADARFAYVFTSFASSAFPAKVLTFTGRRFADVTRRHRNYVKRMARSHWRAYVRYRGRAEVRGVFAAWAAEMYTLGQGKRAQRELRRGVKRRWFGGRREWRRGSAYARYLNRFLRRTGYR